MVSAGGVLEPDGVSLLERRLNVSSSTSKPAMVATTDSAVKSRVEAFLTEFSKAQEDLKAKPSSEIDIERVDADKPYIEMVLDCGMVDLLNEEAVQAAERAMASGQKLEELCRATSDDSSTDTDESDSQQCDNQVGHTHTPQRKGCATSKPGVQRKRRKLVEEL